MINIKQADLSDPEQAKTIIELLDSYARHPMGGGEPLPEFTRNNLVDTLRERQGSLVLLAYDGDRAIGLCNCFEGFSTFSCKPLLNIHDLFVAEGYRNQGIAKQILQYAEQLATNNGCCKLTLEVLSGNAAAKKSYSGFGFKPYKLHDEFGQAEFWQKYI